ncbi:MAG TPA: DsrE/DsrF/DrsH-like family protein [Saprospiraceae bacterium]|nr:DsrE/DsrF/DrsH-like family protein [Saprospiraceae bacterium]
MHIQVDAIHKICIICSKSGIEDVYSALILANGAVMEGMEANLFFTFFGLDAITKKRMKRLKTPAIGNPSLRFLNGLPFPSFLGFLPGVEAIISGSMHRRLEKKGIPGTEEFLQMITAGGGKLYACKLAMELFKLKKADLSDEIAGIITVGEFYEQCSGDRTQIIYI